MVKLLSSLREELLIIVVVPNPKPCDRIPLKDTNCSITPCDAYGPNILVLVDALET
jgi:hypothetical protein